MPENRARFVLVCQQTFALAAVAAVAASAVSVVELEIVTPGAGATTQAVASPRPQALVSDAPVEPKLRNVPLGGQTSSAMETSPPQSGRPQIRAQQIRVVSEPERVTGYATVGVTWKQEERLTEEQLEISVRTKDDGSWSPWQEMHFDPDHAPDPGTTEDEAARDVRAGTDAVVVGDVEDVQVRAVSRTGETPEGLALAIVDPGENRVIQQEPEIEAGALMSVTTEPARLAAGVPQPRIYSRAQWGADERLRDGSPSYGEIHAGFVHHTVNANDYSKDEVPSIIRGIYAFHTQGRGWSDVGYNFLVDRFGRIWEGRYGGVDRPVVGAHTLGYNSDSFAMSAIGNFEEVSPSEDVVRAYADLMAWKLALHGVAADDTHQYVTSRYFHAINGHRDAGSTACPGRYLYDRLSDIRSLAARRQDSPAEPSEPGPSLTDPTVRDANLSGRRWPDLAVRDRRTRHLVFIRTGGQMDFGKTRLDEGDWSGMDLLVAPGDLDGDRVSDILARDASSGQTGFYPGAGDTGPRAAVVTTGRFAKLDQLTAVGDFDGDGERDLVGRSEASQRLLLYRGKGGGLFRRAVELAPDWSRYDLTIGVNDFDSDGQADLMARSGRLLYLFRGRGGLLARAAPISIPGRWHRFDFLSGRGDATNDREPDLIARSRKGRTYLYPGDGSGGLRDRVGPYGAYDDVRWLSIGGQLAESGRADIVAMSARGRLLVYPNSGRRNLVRSVDTGISVAAADLVLNVGDWNGDERADVMTRDARTGRLYFHANRGRGRLAAPVKAAGRGWGRVSHVTAVGDMTGDGHPDLMGRKSGEYRVWVGDGADGFDGYVAGARPLTSRLGATSDYDWIVGLVDVDGDDRGDFMTRDASDGRLYWMRGKKRGFSEPRFISEGLDAYDLGG